MWEAEMMRRKVCTQDLPSDPPSAQETWVWSSGLANPELHPSYCGGEGREYRVREG